MLIKTFRRFLSDYVGKTVVLHKHIQLQQNKLEYILRISPRAKRLSLVVHPDGRLAVTIPRRVPLQAVEHFMVSKAGWILKKLDYFRSFPSRIGRKNTRAAYLEHKEKARQLAEKKIEEFNRMYGFRFRRISIKNQKTRWGSCSRKGNLNFNYKIALLSERLSDYIIVHELCHLGAFNHSQKFWNLVERTIPDYKERRKELRKKGLEMSV